MKCFTVQVSPSETYTEGANEIQYFIKQALKLQEICITYIKGNNLKLNGYQSIPGEGKYEENIDVKRKNENKPKEMGVNREKSNVTQMRKIVEMMATRLSQPLLAESLEDPLKYSILTVADEVVAGELLKVSAPEVMV